MAKNDIFEYIHNIFLVKRYAYEETSRRNGLLPIDVHILTFVDMHADDSTAADIERDHKIKKNTISVHVDYLMKNGYLERQCSEDDRRKMVLLLTPSGKAIAAECEEMLLDMNKKLNEGLTDEDKATLLRCFERVNENALRLLSEH